MRNAENKPLVTTHKEHCRICYTCVRECPAKAIRIADGQAEVIPERCIGCGNCFRVCSQKAKVVLDSKRSVYELLKGNQPTAAIVAPSFPAEFTEYDWRKFAGMVRALGFEYVHEVAFGADLVAARFRELFEEDKTGRYIATSCPAIVAYVERYHPDLVDNLAPVVSPMVASARAVKQIHGEDMQIVFIGPCIAKKGEIASDNLPGELDEGLTFLELREMFMESGIDADSVADSDFDGPQAGTGAIFPIGRGLLQAANIKEDLIEGDVVAVEGGGDFTQAFREFESGDLDVRLLEVLACDGCITGPGISSEAPLFSRRAKVSKYVQERMRSFDREQWEKDLAKFRGIDLSRGFSAFDQRIATPLRDEIGEILAKMGKFSPADELNCGACGYTTCREHAIAIFKGLAETEMCLPYTIEQLNKAFKELASSNEQLASTQEQLMQSEKLASMGQLAAGIAHEVNNPLGVVLMYSHLLLDEFGDDPKMKEDLNMIAEQADRCKKIVAGLLNFARRSKVLRQPTDVSDLIEKTVKAVPRNSGIEVEFENGLDDPVAEIDRDQIGQVLTNLISNAYGAMDGGGKLTVGACCEDGMLRIKVSDTGVGIPEENLKKIFDPFFTTKQMGMGTGLGLAVTYGIVKMHSGDIRVESNSDAEKGPTGTTFSITLPRKAVES